MVHGLVDLLPLPLPLPSVLQLMPWRWRRRWQYRRRRCIQRPSAAAVALNAPCQPRLHLAPAALLRIQTVVRLLRLRLCSLRLEMEVEVSSGGSCATGASVAHGPRRSSGVCAEWRQRGWIG